MQQKAKVSVPTEETQGSVSSHSWESTGQTSLRTFRKKTYSHNPLAIPGKEKKSKNTDSAIVIIITVVLAV